MVSHDLVAFYLLSEEVSRHVKVVQSGQGADEVFAGYHWYQTLSSARRATASTSTAAVFFDRTPAEIAEVVADSTSARPATSRASFVRRAVRRERHRRRSSSARCASTPR